jgi:hypothetical protein
MKHLIKTLLAAAVLAAPVAVQAQSPIDTDVPLSIESHPFKTRGTGFPAAGFGGGFIADFTIDFATNPSAKFNDFLVWCIDPNRLISVPGGPYKYSAYTAMSFANTNFGGANGYNVTVGDMKKIVGLVADLNTNWASYTVQQREDRQGSIWSIFRGQAPVLANTVGGDLSGWLVLYNGQNQTFVSYVPEPADIALLVTAMGGLALMLVARRRRA